MGGTQLWQTPIFALTNMATLKFDTYDSLARAPLSPFSVTTSKPMRVLPFRTSSVKNPLVEMAVSCNSLHTFCTNVVLPMPGRTKLVMSQHFNTLFFFLQNVLC